MTYESNNILKVKFVKRLNYQWKRQFFDVEICSSNPVAEKAYDNFDKCKNHIERIILFMKYCL